FNASEDNPISFEVIDIVYAGKPSNKKLENNKAIRIMTGGKMPIGSNCVIRLEDCIEKDDKVIIKKQLKPYENYCFEGEDIKTGQLLIKKRRKLSAIELGILGSMGQDKVEVIRKPRIGILVTGDEIVDYKSKLLDGKIYDTNGILIASRLRELGFESIEIDKKEDDIKTITNAILDNINDLDMIITTGGVSVGDKDIINDVIKNIGAEQLFWRLKFKPGTPAMYSIKDDKPILSLSGNPFAALATFELLARPLIANISGDIKVNTTKREGIMLKDFNKKSKNRRFIRCIYKDGQVDLPEGGHASGMLSSMSGCNALIDIEAGNTGLKKGDRVKVVLL
ncbi:molybdopterin molybdotransferase MoeA, partial [Clostridium cochlearium]|uniref:molybdopterin molybdotransferase MoeA n=1 Tax=Clostridium cochlearium TaxID=1494 RepID=UPI0018074DFE